MALDLMINQLLPEDICNFIKKPVITIVVIAYVIHAGIRRELTDSIFINFLKGPL
jgi:hypothetical protein